MISKLHTFRSSKLLSSKDGKENNFHMFNSLVPNQKDPEDTEAKQGYQSPDITSEATHISDENLSLDSPRTYFSYEGQESVTTSSSLSEERNICRPLWLPYEEAEEQFLEDHESYFLHLSVDNVRKDQYSKLDLQRITYLDHATCPLFSQFQVEQHMQFLLDETHPFLGSNYIRDRQSELQHSYIERTCEHILSLLNTNKEEYSVIFTSGVSSCYRHFGEMHHFPKGSLVLTTQDHHKFIQYMINGATQSNLKVGNIPLKKKDLCICVTDFQKLLRKRGWSSHGCGLLVYPAQSFSSGICHSLNWIASAQQSGWEVLLDVSSCIPTVGVDISLYQPEFVIGSLYHVLGYPTSVGYLLVRRSSHSLCREKGSAKLRIAEMTEDGKAVHILTEAGSLNAHTFASLYFGLEHLEGVGIVAIQKRIRSLVSWLIKALKSLKHKVDSKPLLKLYGSPDLQHRGSILAFNVLDPTGSIFPPRLVQRLAAISNIFMGTASVCDLSRDFHQTYHRHLDSGGLPASAGHEEVLRLSLGPVSNFSDVYRLAQFLSRFRDEDYMASEAAGYAVELEKDC